MFSIGWTGRRAGTVRIVTWLPCSARSTTCGFAERGSEDDCPVEDLGIRRGMEELFGDLSRAEMVDRAEPWRPYRSYASLYLWRAVD